MKSYFTEIISQSEFQQEFGGKVREVQKSEKYRSRLKTMLKRFFTEPGDKIAKRVVVVPFSNVKPKGLTEQDKRIIRYLNDHGYLATPESYEIGLATTPKGKQVAIMQILKEISNYKKDKLEAQKAKAPAQGKEAIEKRLKAVSNFRKEWLSYYKNLDNKLKQSIVFTWVPRKIASQSTKVGWRSCQELFTGEYKKYVFSGMEAGQFIAWLVKQGDENKLENPVARVLIKAYTNGEEVFWAPAKKVYGSAPGDFREKVKQFLASKQKDVSGVFDFDDEQYDDGEEDRVVRLGDNFTINDIIAAEGKADVTDASLTRAIKKAPSRAVDGIENVLRTILAGGHEKALSAYKEKGYPLEIEDSLDLQGNKITSLPKGLKVKGDLGLQGTEITSLPKGLKVKGDLHLPGTKITSLPEELEVEGSIDLENTKITSLPEGLEVGGYLDIQGTKITSLPEGLKVGSHLFLQGTEITSLPEGLEVRGDLDLENTKITSLPDGLNVGGSLYLSGSKITSLPDGLEVGGSLDLQGTEITSLPKGLNVRRHLFLQGTEITSLPRGLKVKGKLDLRGSKITSLPDGLNVGGSLYLNRTEITSLPDGLNVKGSLYLQDTEITSLPDDLSVGGEIYRDF